MVKAITHLIVMLSILPVLACNQSQTQNEFSKEIIVTDNGTQFDMPTTRTIPALGIPIPPPQHATPNSTQLTVTTTPLPVELPTYPTVSPTKLPFIHTAKSSQFVTRGTTTVSKILPTSTFTATEVPIPPANTISLTTAIPIATVTKYPIIPTAIPTQILIVPTATDTQITQTPTAVTISKTIIDTFGFTWLLDGEIKYETSGLTKEGAKKNEGVIFFEYGGINGVLIWFDDAISALETIILDNFNSLSASQPQLTFEPISEGNTTIGSNHSQYLTFLIKNPSGESEGGGIIGSWKCASSKALALTVTASDAAVLQIRFKKLLDGFTCDN